VQSTSSDAPRLPAAYDEKCSWPLRPWCIHRIFAAHTRDSSRPLFGGENPRPPHQDRSCVLRYTRRMAIPIDASDQSSVLPNDTYSTCIRAEALHLCLWSVHPGFHGSGMQRDDGRDGSWWALKRYRGTVCRRSTVYRNVQECCKTTVMAT
jgi:hypothetical protein